VIDPESFYKYSLFGGIAPEEIRKIEPLLCTATFPAGEVLIREGEPNDRVFFIREGRVEVTKKGIPLATLGEGDVFGEMELIDVMPSAATIRTLSVTSVSALSNRALHEIYHMNPGTFALIVMNLARDLSRRLRRMDELAAGRKT
jgi:CRP/FNR family transcriptional regulator, cyclic AMP receptor protein